jgi:ubiquinone/menaquinone biosynthesis C-methylase UbiE
LARFKHYGFAHDREQIANSPMNRPAHDPETLANRQKILKREARLRRFGYDSPGAIQFVLAQAMPLGGAVLEVGTGKGRFLVRLARHVAAVTTVDIAAEEQVCARLNARYAGVEEKIRFVLQDAARLPWPDATFDAAVTMNAMHHIAHFEQVLEEMLRVVKPGGRIVLADFSPRGFQIIAREHRAEGKTHPHERYDFRELQRLLRERGLVTRLRKSCNQEVLAAGVPVAAA